MAEEVQTAASTGIAGVVPGIGPTVKVLGWIYDACNQVKECKESCVFTHRRLTVILEELEMMETSGAAVPSGAVEKFHESLTVLWTNLAPYQGMVFFERLLRHWKLEDTITSVNRKLDKLCEILSVASGRAMMEWKMKWNDDMYVQNEMLLNLMEDDREAVKEIQTIQHQEDMILLLKVELQAIRVSKSAHPPEVKELINKSLRTLIVKTNARVQDVPPWFVAEASITYMPTPFGIGSFGSVHSGKFIGSDVVVKLLLPGERGLDRGSQETFIAEMNILFDLNHPHVIKTFGACHVSSRPFIVVERAKENLAECLERDIASKKRMWSLLHQVAIGLEYLHSRKLVHGDLKLNNILIGGDGLARIADFGLRRVKSSSRSTTITLASGKAVKGFRWMAPEQFLRMPHFLSDIYALGMCIIEATTGDEPYGTMDDDSVRELVKNGIRPARPASLSDRGWTLVTKMTEKDFMKRISLKDAITELREFADFEASHREASSPHCLICNASQRVGGTRCEVCGRSLHEDDDTVRQPPAQAQTDVQVGSLLKDTASASEDTKTQDANLLDSRMDDKSTCAEISTGGVVGTLLAVANEGKSFLLALVALGCFGGFLWLKGKSIQSI